MNSNIDKRLVTLFGDVPLITSELLLEEDSKGVPRILVHQVWDFVSEELTQAANTLQVIQKEVGRITKVQPWEYKARAMLYAGRYEEATMVAKQVMDLGVNQLYPSYENLFTIE